MYKAATPCNTSDICIRSLVAHSFIRNFIILAQLDQHGEARDAYSQWPNRLLKLDSQVNSYSISRLAGLGVENPPNAHSQRLNCLLELASQAYPRFCLLI